jgi:arylsulfatase
MECRDDNVLLIMCDQHRADCIGVQGHPVVQTPTLDGLALHGSNFRKAYSATALCAPARRTLLSGQLPRRHGVLGERYEVPLPGITIQRVLAEVGYRTHLVGKLHLWPLRHGYGFETADWADWIDPRVENDYTTFMKVNARGRQWMRGVHQFNQNSRKVCEWALEDPLHVTNWCTDAALRFLESTTASRKFFLMVSYIAPHPPLFPLPRLLQKYLARPSTGHLRGEWSRQFSSSSAEGRFLAWSGSVSPEALHLMRSAYYAAIEHVDSEIGRLLGAIPSNTLIIYVSDHGDMLGDHFLYRKRAPYESSSRVPLIVRLPDSAHEGIAPWIDAPVELMDVMPTILDWLGIPCPETSNGASLLPAIRGEPFARQWVFGENPMVPAVKSRMHFVTDGEWKYVWYPDCEWEQLFHLKADPGETEDLAARPERSDQLRHMKKLVLQSLD